MRDIEKISAKVEKKKKHLQALFDKDQENYDLWDGKEQTFDTHKMAINITGTEMVALAHKVQASIVRSRLDIHVIPPDKYANPEGIDAANQEERMYYHGFEKADEKLSMVGEASLLSSATWQSIVLGRVAVRVLVYPNKENDEIIWDYLPLNPRFLTFSFDSNGLSWACYETFRSSDSILEEYGEEVNDDEGKGVSVSDYWDRQHNVRFLTKDKKILGKVWKHPFPNVPIIIQPITIGPKAVDDEGIKVTTWGQSVFDHVKVSFRKLNMMRSIAATHAHMLAKRPIDHTYQAGTTPSIEEDNFNFYAGAKLSHPDTETLKGMDIPDIPSSLMAMMGDLSAGIKNATYTELNPDVAAHSGSALRILGQDKQDVLTPRVDALDNLYTRICKMAKCQIITQKLTIPVRTVMNKSYEIFDMKPKLLDNDFYIRAELVKQDVYDEEASLQKAQMLMQNRLMSREDVMERILNEQDVPTQIIKMDTEEVEAAIPELKLKKVIKSYIDRKMYEEANMAIEQLAMLEIQKQQSLASTMGQEGMTQAASPQETSPQGQQSPMPATQQNVPMPMPAGGVNA